MPKRKMMMTVVFTVEISDDSVSADELCLDLDPDVITVGSIHREQVGAKILEYGTTSVREV